MKANKFPGNVMKEHGIKSWCQLGVVTVGALVGALVLLLMGMHGWSLDWNGPLSGTGWMYLWNFICALVSMFGVIVTAIVGIGTIAYVSYCGAKQGWVWARDNCEQINYEDDENV